MLSSVRRILFLTPVCLFLCFAGSLHAEPAEYDVVVYGGTSGGVTAAVQAARMGKKVVLIDPGDYVGKNTDGTSRYVSHLGGLSSGGLGATDVGDKDAIGGLSYDFYRRVKGWDYGSEGDYDIEAYKAENVYDSMVSEAGVNVVRLERLKLSGGVSKTGTTIQSITTHTGNTYKGKMFIDATYEGDLLATAGVGYTVGREARSRYNENFNGLAYDTTHEHIFGSSNVDPYVTPGDASSGLLPGVQATGRVGPNGAEDHRIQAYCYRMTWTDSSNRVKWTSLWGANGQDPPEGYDRSRYELHDRFIKTGKSLGDVVRLDTGIPGGKNDINNWGPASTDFIGGNYDVYIPATDRVTNYAEATHQEREYIIQQHIEYTKGFLYYLAFDAPEGIRNSMAKWGLAADEFTDNENFPHQLYVREARRMLGAYVMTEADCRNERDTPVSVGLGAYPIDSHNTHRYIEDDGYVEVEGNFWLGNIRETYEIAYGSITPKAGEVGNLLVTSALSASHTAYGSLRMEPVFMVLGQSAATAAVQAIDQGTAVQDIDFDVYQKIMRAYGQVLSLNEPSPGQYVGMIREDFNYGPNGANLEQVSYVAPGWAEPWDADSADPQYDSGGNLTYQAKGYVNSRSYAFSGAAGNGSGERSGNITTRAIRGGMSGTAWMTALVKVDRVTGAESILWMDGTDADDALGVADDGSLELFGQHLEGSYDDGSVHLLLARLNVVDGNDSVDLWIDPDLQQLGEAQLSADGADLFGSTLDLLGMSVGDNGGVIDAIRLSNSETAFGDVLGLMAGDATMDLVIDLDDASLLLSNFGQTSGQSWGDGDFDGDGDVDSEDASYLLANWQATYGTIESAPQQLKDLAAIPEPASLILLAAGGLALLKRRR
ncbi:MAG: FAD-dependent oxidoreductase [Phycisphaerae bacterium]